mmetsp:Transcript_19651/g.34826  ORF Transcript_19651/g.34826 Transcript_19651/m.34826 type:complete len:202 (-) Transcript_19651:1260-1865(-)
MLDRQGSGQIKQIYLAFQLRVDAEKHRLQTLHPLLLHLLVRCASCRVLPGRSVVLCSDTTLWLSKPRRTGQGQQLGCLSASLTRLLRAVVFAVLDRWESDHQRDLHRRNPQWIIHVVPNALKDSHPISSWQQLHVRALKLEIFCRALDADIRHDETIALRALEFIGCWKFFDVLAHPSCVPPASSRDHTVLGHDLHAACFA